MKYMMIHYIDESLLSEDPASEAAGAGEERALEAWDTEMISRGILVGGGLLTTASETTTMRVRGGKLLVTDGPFAETKEQIAGYGILECDSLDQAVEVSARHPTATWGTFELRAFAGESDPAADEKRTLLTFLAFQRAAVLRAVDGLGEKAWHQAVVPSGWTPAGLVEHLGDAERHWFSQVVTGSAEDLPRDAGRPPYDPHMAFTCGQPSAEVVAYYRDQCARSDAILARAPLSAAPRGRHGDPGGEEPPDVRTVVLHMIEETACHAGHLDIARELLDGRTGLGLR